MKFHLDEDTTWTQQRFIVLLSILLISITGAVVSGDVFQLWHRVQSVLTLAGR